MYLSDFVNKEDVLREAFKHPALKIKPRSDHRPDIDTAVKAVMSTIEMQTIQNVAAEMQPIFEDILLNQELMDGEHELSDNQTEWEAAVDDKVEEAIEKYVPVLSADWLGRNTIACSLHEKDGCKKLAMGMGREVYKQLTYEYAKTPAQIMSNAGIVQADVEAALAAHLNVTKKEKDTMAQEEDEALVEVVGKIAFFLDPDFNDKQVRDDLDLASDDDEGLAMGAAPRLGLDAQDVEVLQGFRFMHGDATADVLLAMVKEYNDPAEEEEPKKPAKKKSTSKKAKGKAKAEAPKGEDAVAVEGTIPPTVFQSLKEVKKDNDMAQGMGVSRATYNNWSNGRSECSDLSGDQYAFLRGELVERINTLHEALAAIDGTEPEVVF